MRVQPHGVDSILHVVKRGARGLDIVRDDADRYDFTKLLFYINDSHEVDHWRRDVAALTHLEWPPHWPEQKPLTRILAWTLMPNHFHLILQQITEGGIAKFMQRLCGSMSVCYNLKYDGTGSIFQGGYKGRVVEADADLRYLTSYVLAKNVLELHPKGLVHAARTFETSWQWALGYPFSSLRTVALNEHSPIVEHSLLMELFASAEYFKEDSRDMVLSHVEKKAYDTDLMLE